MKMPRVPALLTLALSLATSTARAQVQEQTSDDAPPAAPPPVTSPIVTQPAYATPYPTYEQPAPATVLPRQPREPTPLGFRFDGAYTPRQLFALTVPSADLGIAFGGRPSRNFAWWIAPRYSTGATDNGLRVWSGRIGGEIEIVLDPVRIGFGGSVLAMGIERAASDADIRAYGVEGRLILQVDIVRNDDYALFLRGSLDGATASGAAFWGPGIGLGVELDVRGKRRPEWASRASKFPVF